MKDFRDIVFAIKQQKPEFDKDQTAFAEDLGLSRQNMNQYFTSNRLPYNYLVEWCEKYDYSLDNLLYNGKLENRHVRTQEDKLTFTVLDDAMAPTMQPGEVLTFTPEVKKIESNKIYLLNRGSEIIVVRLIQMVSEQTILIRRDNPHYPEEKMSLDEILPMIKGKATHIQKSLESF